MHEQKIYTVGGNVQAGGGVYIARKADEELLALCRNGDFAYVLAPRQVGKSSLMVHTSERLLELDVRSVTIDLSQIGVRVDEESWYLSIMSNIEDQLELSTSSTSWWSTQSQLSFAQRFGLFFQRVVLAEIQKRVVIFIDEIDTTLSLSFTDDFYALIRALYDARAHAPVFNRLSFVLIGVATPGDLIQDLKRTPFNIGRRVEITDFTFKEALPFADGLGKSKEDANRILKRVFEWTSGHPYLTQRILQALIVQPNPIEYKNDVDRVIRQLFFGEMSLQDNNLQFVRDMLTKHVIDDINSISVLNTYYNIRRGRIVFDSVHSRVHNYLKLTGIVKRIKGTLRVRNGIYWHIFDKKWVKSYIPIDWKRIFQRIGVGIIVAFLSSALIVVVFALSKITEATNIESEAKIQQTALAVTQARVVQTLSVIANRETEVQGVAKIFQTEQQQLLLASTATILKQRAEQTVQTAVQARLQTAEQERLIAVAAQEDAQIRQSDAEKTSTAAFLTATSIFAAQQIAQRERNIALTQAATTGAALNTAVVERDWAVATREIAETERAEAIASLQTIVYTPEARVTPTLTPIESRAINCDISLISSTKTACLKALPHTQLVLNANFSLDEQNIVTASQDRNVIVWDVQTGSEKVIIPLDDAAQSASFSPDGRLIVTASNNKKAQIWALQQSRATLLTETKGISETVVNAMFSPDGKKIATASVDNTAVLWDAVSGSSIGVLAENDGLKTHDNVVRTVVFSNDGQKILTASCDGTVKIWDTTTRRLTEPPFGLAAVGSNCLLYGAALSEDGEYIATAGGDGKVNVWSVKEHRVVDVFFVDSTSSAARSVAFHPNGRYVAAVGVEGILTIRDITSRKNIITIPVTRWGAAYSVAFNKSGNRIVIACNDNVARLWKIVLP